MKADNGRGLLGILFLFFSTTYGDYSFAIQPLGQFDSVLIESIIPAIKSQFNNPRIIVCKSIPMPQKAYYQPRNRYRAEILLDYLDSLQNGQYTKIIGLTKIDISTTKGKFPDWGIFGYGGINSAPCVISIYRLQKNASKKLFLERFIKVVIHELGHTFGLEHCSNPLCIMADYKGTIKSLDMTRNKFCAACSVGISKSIQFLSIN